MGKPKWVDYAQVKREVSLERVLERYDLLESMKRGKDSLSGPCPLHSGNNPTSFRVTPSKGLFHCFSCEAAGNVIDFVAAYEELEFRDAALKIADRFGIKAGRNGSKKTPPARDETPSDAASEEPRINKPLSFSLNKLDPEHPYLQERGLTPEEIETFGLGYCSRGILKGRIAIPIHNAVGELVAYAGRWPASEGWPELEGKYKFPEGFGKSLELYNLHRVIARSRHDVLTIVEGFFDAIRLHRFGVAVVATMGSALSEEQADLAADCVGDDGHVCVLFDNDDAGRAARDRALVFLGSRVYVRAFNLPEEGQQPEDLADDEIREFLQFCDH